MVRPSSILKAASGNRNKDGVQPAGIGVDDTGLTPSGADRREPFRHLICQQCAPRVLRQLPAQRQAGQRVERVVEIDQELAPLHAGDVRGRAHLQVRHRELLRGGGGIPLDHDVAGGSAMISPLARCNHIEWDHRGQHASARQPLAQDRSIADAVLQADDDGLRRRVGGNDVGDSGGIGAFDGHQHRTDVGKDSAVLRQRQLAGCDPPLKALEAGQPQPIAFDFPDHARARQQRNAAAGSRQHAADKAADAAGAGHRDRSVRDHPAAFH